jgi:hypothetical protein
MGVATLELPPPASLNVSNRGNPKARHRRKRQTQGILAQLLLAADVPRPIPGAHARASAELLFPPPARRRDEGNYRTALEKALGDALAPAPTAEERALGLAPVFVWLPDDTPEHFTFGAVTFGVTDLDPSTGKHRAAVARVRLVWGDDLIAELDRETAELRRRIGTTADELEEAAM